MRKVPLSTYVLMVCVMGLWFSCATIITMEAPSYSEWLWWLIPIALAIPTGVILRMRYAARRRLRAELRASVNEQVQ